MLFLVKRSAMKNNNQKCCLQVLGGCVGWRQIHQGRGFLLRRRRLFSEKWLHLFFSADGPTCSRRPIDGTNRNGTVTRRCPFSSCLGNRSWENIRRVVRDFLAHPLLMRMVDRHALHPHGGTRYDVIQRRKRVIFCHQSSWNSWYFRQGHSKTFDICKQTEGKVLFFFLLLIAADGQLLSLNGDDVRHYRLTVTNVNLEKSATRHEGLANKKGKTGGMGQQVNNRSVSIAVRHLAIIPTVV